MVTRITGVRGVKGDRLEGGWYIVDSDNQVRQMCHRLKGQMACPGAIYYGPIELVPPSDLPTVVQVDGWRLDYTDLGDAYCQLDAIGPENWLRFRGPSKADIEAKWNAIAATLGKPAAPPAVVGLGADPRPPVVDIVELRPKGWSVQVQSSGLKWYVKSHSVGVSIHTDGYTRNDAVESWNVIAEKL